MPKIAFLGVFHPFRGGIAQFTENLANCLIGNEIKVFTFIKQYPPLIFPGKVQLDSASPPANISIEQVYTPYLPHTWHSAIKAINEWQADMVIFNYSIPFFAPSFVYILKRLKCQQIIGVVHNIKFHEKWLLGNFLTKKTLAPCTKIICLSEVVRRDALTILKKKTEDIVCIPHPVYESRPLADIELTAFKKKYKLENNKILLFFGYIKKYKGLDILLAAMPRVLTKYPDTVLVIAGEVYGNDNEYFGQIKNLGITKQIIFHNYFVDTSEIAKYFGVADLVVQPYRSATQSGISQLAFAYDTPMVATNIGGLSEVIKHRQNGILVAPESHEEIADGIIEYFEKDYQAAFVTQIKIDKQKYSWHAYQTYIESLL